MGGGGGGAGVVIGVAGGSSPVLTIRSPEQPVLSAMSDTAVPISRVTRISTTSVPEPDARGSAGVGDPPPIQRTPGVPADSNSLSLHALRTACPPKSLLK